MTGAIDMLAPLRSYTVTIQETVSYAVTVEAEDEDMAEAEAMVRLAEVRNGSEFLVNIEECLVTSIEEN